MNTRDLLLLANHLWQSSIFAIAVWLLTLALKKNRAALRYWLWLAASVKFIVPFSLLVNVGGLVRWRTTPIPPQIQSLSVIETVSQPFLRAGQFTNQGGAASTDSLGLVLLGIWVCGFAANLMFWVWCGKRIRVARRNSTPLRLGIPVPVFSTNSRMGPSVFGLRKPVVLLPGGITAHLSPAQLDLVVGHKMCHIIRRDNLTAAIPMIVETLFWFYPVVWWIRAQLVTERELACDEEICEQGHAPEEYAECILKVCRFYITSTPIWVSGVTGGSLKRRIRAILTNSKPKRLGIRKKDDAGALGELRDYGASRGRHYQCTSN
ncbi:MAG TPA: M56 family metallopeptidase [Bryobacteraceae bacterium]